MSIAPSPPAACPARSPGWVRWIICGLLFVATTVNYIDRQVIGILKPHLARELDWSEMDYARIVLAFQVAYAAGYCLAGRFMDVIGLRAGYGLAVALWSLAAMAHAAMRSVAGFQAARFALGLAEGGNFPAAVKTVSEWFPRSERALATGIFNAGSNVGALITPLLVPWLTVKFGWPAAFLVTGTLGFVWLVGWVSVYRAPDQHRWLSAREWAHIRQDPPDPPVRLGWLQLVRHRQVWAFAVGMFLTSPIWWMYLYWVPDFLNKQYGLNLLQLGPPLVAIYLMTDAGSVAGGWLSSCLIRRGWSVNAARKTALLSCALCVVPIFFASQVSGLWVAVGLIGLAASAHQGWSANLYTLVSDTVPRQAVSTVVGLGGMAGAVGGMGIATFMGWILDRTGSYLIPFALPGFAYLTALGIIHVLLPRLEPLKLERSGADGKLSRAPGWP